MDVIPHHFMNPNLEKRTLKELKKKDMNTTKCAVFSRKINDKKKPQSLAMLIA